LFFIFSRLYVVESVGVNGLVIFCAEEVVYFFIRGTVDVYVEGVGCYCFFKVIACGEQHEDHDDEEEEG
jgi:hypothetical protein